MIIQSEEEVKLYLDKRHIVRIGEYPDVEEVVFEMVSPNLRFARLARYNQFSTQFKTVGWFELSKVAILDTLP